VKDIPSTPLPPMTPPGVRPSSFEHNGGQERDPLPASRQAYTERPGQVCMIPGLHSKRTIHLCFFISNSHFNPGCCWLCCTNWIHEQAFP
jgi:hypothetical protein